MYVRQALKWAKALIFFVGRAVAVAAMIYCVGWLLAIGAFAGVKTGARLFGPMHTEVTTTVHYRE